MKKLKSLKIYFDKEKKNIIMKTIINSLNIFFKKRDNLIVFFIILFSIIGVSLNVFIISSDELWNFQNVYKLYNGFELYKDANVICTPLFFYIGNFILHLLGPNFFSFRIYNIIIDTILFFSTYVLCKKLKIPKTISLIIVFILMLVKRYALVLCMANYNMLALTFFVIGLLCILKENLTKKDLIFQGIIVFLIAFTKQNMGVYYFLAILVIIFLENTTVKKKCINVCMILIPLLLLGIGSIAYFQYAGILNGFIDYAILGIGEFGQKNISLNIAFIIIWISIILLNVLIFKQMKKNALLTEKKYKILKRVIIISIFLTFSIFPIMNFAHFMIGMYLAWIVLFYIINFICLDIFRRKYLKIAKYGLIILVCIAIAFSFLNYLNWQENSIKTYNSPYYGGLLDTNTNDKIKNISEYIQKSDKKIIILSHDASLYMVYLKESNGKMDLPFKGNLGMKGEEGLIEELSQMQGVEVFIKKEEDDMNWQESKLVRNFIIQNYECIGEIEDFMIYALENKN